MKDKEVIKKCIELAKEGLAQGQAPFASIIVKDGQIIAESANGSNGRVSDHAEVLALDKAHKFLKNPDLSGCTLYTIAEPCPMCSFMIREYRIDKVVFALSSPFMGGYSKWPILQDTELNQFKDYFALPPQVIAGILEIEAKEVFDQTPLWMFGGQAKSK
ncbi:MAG: nucleoside deaminase [Candidatus Komeilibacteria bacterium]|jgi:tRNA(adenine34) deaminase|nr:nucleoside deaminase [Candidatus Komeilibacteria bacterium]MBT4447276.1 nucleoside deaminase [Candidatus Komeilibacteria bacterium]